METLYSLMPVVPVKLNCQNTGGEMESWRHSIGHGGINKYPLPKKVREGLAGVKPRLVRTFVQEYFNIYPEHGVFDWSSLDPYMESLADSGAKVVACIAIKPKPLYPEIDQRCIMPKNIQEWQQVIEALVHRYSVEKEIVSYWEIANESDIGENGGCPYLTLTPKEYNRYYDITEDAVLRAFPKAKIGGPALADPRSPIMEGLLIHCKETGRQLDFVSWHIYNDLPKAHTDHVYRIREIAEKYYPANSIELLVTEMCCGFQEVSVEDAAYDSFRAASVAASICDMMDAGLSWSFYYHVWDQVFMAQQFKEFYADPDIMLTHWNKIPHRFGLFGVCSEVRPAYFIYKMLGELKGNTVNPDGGAADLRVKSALDESGACRTLLVNYDIRKSRDIIAQLNFSGLKDELKKLSVYRIDKSRSWCGETLELKPTEQRYVDVSSVYSTQQFYCQIYCPANSVALVVLEPATEEQMLSENG